MIEVVGFALANGWESEVGVGTVLMPRFCGW